MKKIIFISLLSIGFFGCEKKFNNEGERIKFKERRDYYTIIEVDGVEYLSCSNGGLIKLEAKKDEEED